MDDNKGVILDSSVWISYLYKEDSQHKKALKLMRDMTETVLVPEYVLLEVATILKNKKYYEHAQKFVTDVFNNRDIFMPANVYLLIPTVELFVEKIKNKLSFVDIALLVMSRHHNVITFDKRLEKAIKESKKT